MNPSTERQPMPKRRRLSEADDANLNNRSAAGDSEDVEMPNEDRKMTGDMVPSSTMGKKSEPRFICFSSFSALTGSLDEVSWHNYMHSA